MNEHVLKNKARLENKIDGLNISNDKKDRMKRALEGILISPKGRLNFEKTPTFEKYLTLKNPDNMPGDYEFCIVDKMISDFSGATENKKFSYPSLSEIADMIDEHKDIIDSEIVDAENYQKMVTATQEPKKQEPAENKSPADLYKEQMKSSIESLPNVPAPQKARAMDVLDALSSTYGNKFFALREEGYSESIALRKDQGYYGYYVISRYFDENTNSTIKRDYKPLGAKSLVKYCEEHKTTIDKEVKKIKAENEKSPAVSITQQEQNTPDDFER